MLFTCACGGGEVEIPTSTGAAGSGGTGGSGGAAGSAGRAGSGGDGGRTGGAAGTAGKGGDGGASGQAGSGGLGGAAGTSGKAGSAGVAGSAGAAGNAGASGSAAGTAGSAGAGTCLTPLGDCPVPKTVCLVAACELAACVEKPAAQGTSCSDGGGSLCDGKGVCVACLADEDCPVSSNECLLPACQAGVCGTAALGLGTKLAKGQTKGDCQAIVCDGSGGTLIQDDDGDVEDDAQSCTTDTCNARKPVHTPVAIGAACADAAGKVCGDPAGPDAGKCLGCNVGADCATGVCGANRACLPAGCGDLTFNGDETDVDCGGPACGATCANTFDCDGPGDCLSNVCTGGACVAGTCNDGILNNTQLGETDVDCGGGTCQKCAFDQGCALNGDCVGGSCVDKKCVATCTDTAKNGDETDVDCGGSCAATGTGKTCANTLSCTVSRDCASGFCNAMAKCAPCAADDQCATKEYCSAGVCVADVASGQACDKDAKCVSNHCVDGLCCDTSCAGSCQACNVAGSEGACKSIPLDADPANECAGATSCDGQGACAPFGKGTLCTDGSECGTGQCVDGVCCDTACTNGCQACDVAGSRGTCSNVPASTDPAGECAGSDVCNGAGACTKVDGAVCATGSDCLGGNCVDGVCCDTTCTGACEACNVGGSEGTCRSIPSGLDPADECVGATACNGAGACTTIGAGKACTTAGECGTGNCVDSLCCDTACAGLCQACDVPGSLGICASVPGGVDPANECAGTDVCNGAAACVKLNGSVCTNGGECGSGNCVDGVCCNVACTGTCQACDVPLLVGTCASVPATTDPANECVGATTCDGIGACTSLSLGVTCTSAAECGSGNCVDGVCCNTSCGGSCRACNVAGSVGLCTDVPTNTDPADECAGGACTGGGACQASNGAVCSAGSQCASANCVDGVCCDLACAGTCQACSAAKSGAANGTCANVTALSDPDNECAGAAVCSAGACIAPGSGSSAATAAVSCAAIHTQYPLLATGSFWIDSDGAGAALPFLTQCDMTTDGGGWTRIEIINNPTVTSVASIAPITDEGLAYTDVLVVSTGAVSDYDYDSPVWGWQGFSTALNVLRFGTAWYFTSPNTPGQAPSCATAHPASNYTILTGQAFCQHGATNYPTVCADVIKVKAPTGLRITGLSNDESACGYSLGDDQFTVKYDIYVR